MPAGPKKSNWASIVKGYTLSFASSFLLTSLPFLSFRPDPPAPAPVPPVLAPVEKPTPATKESDKKPQTSAKKLTLVKKDANAQQPQSNAATPAPSKTLSPAAVERSTELSPVIASHLPVKSPKPAPAAQETLTSVSAPASKPVVQESTLQPSLPPGLGAVNVGARQQKQQQQVRKTKQTSPVVMPIQPNSVSSVPAASVQFGSFGMSAKASATSTGTDPIKRYIIFISLAFSHLSFFSLFLLVLIVPKNLRPVHFNSIHHIPLLLQPKAHALLLHRQLPTTLPLLLLPLLLKWEVLLDFLAVTTSNSNNLD